MRPRIFAGWLRFPASLLGAAGIFLLANGRAQEPAPVQVQPPPPPEFDPAGEPAVRAVAQVLPAVVNISTERVVRRQVQDPFQDFYDQFFEQAPNRSPRILRQKVQSLGSGFLVDPDGLIVTNEHVVERAADLKIQVTFADGATLPARYVTGDKANDLALIRVERKESGWPGFPYIDLGKLSPNLLGQTLLVLGNPLGYNSSVARGILSARDREITVDNTAYKGLVQTDAAINPGNSGGPLIDLAGRLVGVSSVKMAFTPQGTPTQGLGFAIAGKTVAAWVSSHRTAATPAAPRKGAAPAPEPAESNNARNLFGLSLKSGGANSGVVITEVEPDSPAAQAGLRAGMVIFKIGTYAVTKPARVESLLGDVPGGTAVDFVVAPRGAGAQRTETVTVLARNPPTT